MAESPQNVDALEAELRTFRPVAPSPELFDRIGGELESFAPPRRLRAWLVGTLAAACLAVAAALVWRLSRPVDVGPVRIAATLPVPMTERDDDRPALASYRRALARSPEALDDLLDRHAARMLAPGAARLTASSDVGVLR